MLNWPGRKVKPSPVAGTRSSVAVSCVSRRTRRTTNGTGTMGSGRRACTRSSGGTVHVEQLQPGRLQPAADHRDQPHQQHVAERRILFALLPDAGRVETDGAHQLKRPGVKGPPVRGKQPGPAYDVVLADR